MFIAMWFPAKPKLIKLRIHCVANSDIRESIGIFQSTVDRGGDKKTPVRFWDWLITGAHGLTKKWRGGGEIKGILWG